MRKLPILCQVSYNIIPKFRNIILIRNIFPHLKFKYVPRADFYEIRNTATDEFAFCDGTLIVALVTLQEPYFPKHVFSYNNLENFVLFLENAGICVTNLTHYEKKPLKMLKNYLCRISVAPPTLKSMDKYRGYPNVILIVYL